MQHDRSPALAGRPTRRWSGSRGSRGAGRTDPPGGPLPARHRPTTRVLVAADMALIRGAFAALLSLEDDIEVIAELDRSDSLASAAHELEPDAVVIDMGNAAVDAAHSMVQQLRDELPHCQVLLVTGAMSPRALRRVLDAGVRGVILKTAPAGQLAEGIRRVASGELVIDSQLATAALASPDDPLSDREYEVLELAAEGATASEIASQLCLAVGTVQNYISAAINKLGARNRSDAVRIARASGFL
jgi:two-component system response regulator DesR